MASFGLHIVKVETPSRTKSLKSRRQQALSPVREYDQDTIKSRLKLWQHFEHISFVESDISESAIGPQVFERIAMGHRILFNADDLGSLTVAADH
jgi:hypothetical protein